MAAERLTSATSASALLQCWRPRAAVERDRRDSTRRCLADHSQHRRRIPRPAGHLPRREPQSDERARALRSPGPGGPQQAWPAGGQPGPARQQPVRRPGVAGTADRPAGLAGPGRRQPYRRADGIRTPRPVAAAGTRPPARRAGSSPRPRSSSVRCQPVPQAWRAARSRRPTRPARFRRPWRAAGPGAPWSTPSEPTPTGEEPHAGRDHGHRRRGRPGGRRGGLLLRHPRHQQFDGQRSTHRRSRSPRCSPPCATPIRSVLPISWTRPRHHCSPT